MDTKRGFFNFSLAFAMLFAILFQSLHSVEHLAEQLTTAKCEHQHTESKTQITHQHHDLDHCPICDFTFSSFITSATYSIDRYIATTNFQHFCSNTSGRCLVTDHEISLRGPPSFIV